MAAPCSYTVLPRCQFGPCPNHVTNLMTISIRWHMEDHTHAYGLMSIRIRMESATHGFLPMRTAGPPLLQQSWARPSPAGIRSRGWRKLRRPRTPALDRGIRGGCWLPRIDRHGHPPSGTGRPCRASGGDTRNGLDDPVDMCPEGASRRQQLRGGMGQLGMPEERGVGKERWSRARTRDKPTSVKSAVRKSSRLVVTRDSTGATNGCEALAWRASFIALASSWGGAPCCAEEANASVSRRRRRVAASWVGSTLAMTPARCPAAPTGRGPPPATRFGRRRASRASLRRPEGLRDRLDSDRGHTSTGERFERRLRPVRCRQGFPLLSNHVHTVTYGQSSIRRRMEDTMKCTQHSGASVRTTADRPINTPSSRRSRATAVALPHSPLLARALPRVDWSDAYEVPSRTPPGQPQQWAEAIFHSPPPWIGVLFASREVLVRLVGIEPGGSHVFDSVATTDGEVLLCTDQDHLSFRASVLLEPHRVVLSTVVQVHNRRGQVYSALVRLLHPFVVRTMLTRAARTMTATHDRHPEPPEPSPADNRDPRLPLRPGALHRGSAGRPLDRRGV